MKAPLALLSVLMLAACDTFAMDDWMVEEAASPDRTLVARAWCEDGCDVAVGRAVTISPATQPATPRLPLDDLIGRVVIRRSDAAFSLRWTGSRTLRVAGECLHDGDYKAVPDRRLRGLVIDFVSLPSATPCPTSWA